MEKHAEVITIFLKCDRDHHMYIYIYTYALRYTYSSKRRK